MCKIILGIILLNCLRLVYKNYFRLRQFKFDHKNPYGSELKLGVLIGPFFMIFVYLFLFFNCDIAQKMFFGLIEAFKKLFGFE